MHEMRPTALLDVTALPPLGEEEPGVESVGPQPPALRVVGSMMTAMMMRPVRMRRMPAPKP